MLFDLNSPLPPFRRDVKLVASQDGSFVRLQDAAGYAPNILTIPSIAIAVLEMFDGKSSASFLESFFREQYSVEISSSDIIEFASILDREGYLYSGSFATRKSRADEEYNRQTIRRSVCAGSAYPADPDELREFLARIMKSCDPRDIELGAKGIIAPHIDLNVGGAAYAPAYHAISKSDADLFVIYATSHYASYDLIIPTYKDFETPLGIVRADGELLDDIRRRLTFDITRNDIAHRPEHSIELELIFLQYLFPDREFTILPLLVASFHDFKRPPRFYDKISQTAKAVRDATAESGRKYLFISSGDLAHIGRKFGDTFDAEDKFSELAEEDAALLERLADCDHDGFFSRIKACDDFWKICGASPNYMMLETLRPQRGAALRRDVWNEKETRSAVSFASLAYYE